MNLLFACHRHADEWKIISRWKWGRKGGWGRWMKWVTIRDCEVSQCTCVLYWWITAMMAWAVARSSTCIYRVGQQKWGHKLVAVILSILNRFTISFTGRFLEKFNLIRLLTTPPHLKYVATLPSNLPLIAIFLTLIFHKVMWQHMLGKVGF